MPGPSNIDRRTLLKSSLALPALAMWPERTEAQTTRRARPSRGSVRNIIFLVADGMSAGVPSMAEPYSRMVRGTGTQWHELARSPDVVRGFLETASLSSLVTDSAAAASAWATGSRVFNGSINVLPDGTGLTPIGRLARDAGRAVGVVSTATITHATPATMCAAVTDRIDEFGIAPQLMDVADVVLGGGHPFFSAQYRPDGRDLYAEYRTAGYSICRTRDELLRAPRSPRLLGVFHDTHLPYHVDVLGGHATPAPPRLREMTRAALERLEHAEHGFLLQIEGARVDHAAHANDAAAMLWEQLEFDDAIAEVRAFVKRQPDTLVIVTTDHAVGNPGLIGIGPGYGDSDAAFQRMARARGSFEQVVQTLIGRAGGAAASWDPQSDLIKLIRNATGVELAAHEAATVMRSLSGMPVPSLSKAMSSPYAVLGQVIGNSIGVGWTGTTHTSDIVHLLAFGPGREALAGLHHHTDIFDVLTSAMGIDFENPSMTPDAARGFALPAEMRRGGGGHE